ncbi:hypothetical protein [Ensifer adhaerens]|uniref:hypothetical protein n=1 Tax=Ensifer adhaerens TaxID=106592 RepID=UPI00159EDEC9|nr:hypothetical protein [Ensifer adhaerens]
MIVEDKIVVEKLQQVEVANKQVMDLTKRLAALNEEVVALKNRISTLVSSQHVKPAE